MYGYARRAITLVEVLVVIAVIGLLIALLLPAIQTAREAARKFQCANNLKQQALGVLSYANVHGERLPLYKLGATPPLDDYGHTVGLSWRRAVLPYIELQRLHDMIDEGLGGLAEPNLTVAATPIGVLECPSTPTPRITYPYHLKRFAETANIRFARSDYCGPSSCFGPIDVPGRGVAYRQHLAAAWYAAPDDDTTRDKNLFDGGPRYGSVYPSLREIVDGLSQTILLSELAGGPDTLVFENGILETRDFSWGGCGAWLFYDGCGERGFKPDERHINWHNSSDNSIFFAFHPAGCFVAMADGSTHFLAEETDHKVLQAMVTAREGDTVVWP